VTELAKEYGDGLYALTAEEELSSTVLEQMQTLKACFKAQPEYLRLLSNMALSKEERVGIIDHTLRDQVHPYLLNFLKILCERGILAEFDGCEEAFRESYNRDHQIMEALVTTGVPLDDDQRQKLLGKLAQMTGKQVHLIEKVDPAVIGGVLLEMDGKRYDNTLRHRLGAIRQAMVGEA